MKIVKKVLKIISTIIFAFLCVIIVLIFIYVGRVAYLTKNNRINELKINFYTILTQSMYPNIKAGDIVITYKHDDGVYKKGDVITFVSKTANATGITITHRVIKVMEEDGVHFYKTKGDNNNVEDSGLTPEGNVFGKVVLTVPKIGTIQQFLVTKTGWICAIVIPCAGIVIYDILKMFNVFGLRKRKVKKLDNKADERYEIKLDEGESVDNATDVQDDGRIVIPIEDYVKENIDVSDKPESVEESVTNGIQKEPEPSIFVETAPPRTTTFEEIEEALETSQPEEDNVVETEEVEMVEDEGVKQLEGTVVLEIAPPKVYLLPAPSSEIIYKDRKEFLGVVDFDIEEEKTDNHYDGDVVTPEDMEYFFEEPIIDEIEIVEEDKNEIEKDPIVDEVSLDEIENVDISNIEEEIEIKEESKKEDEEEIELL